MGRRRLDWNRLQQVMDQVRRKSDERCHQRWRPRVSVRPADSAPALLRLAGGCLDLDSGPTRAWAAIGIQGLAPYFFNFAPTLYVRDGGRVAGRISGSYDLYLTQRLILQPQAELNSYSQADR